MESTPNSILPVVPNCLAKISASNSKATSTRINQSHAGTINRLLNQDMPRSLSAKNERKQTLGRRTGGCMECGQKTRQKQRQETKPAPMFSNRQNVAR